MLHKFSTADLDFNPRSLAGATSLGDTNTEGPANFNPRSLAGATHTSLLLGFCISYFNPRSLAGATQLSAYYARAEEFQSTLPRGSDRVTVTDRSAEIDISIHAPSRERLDVA